MADETRCGQNPVFMGAVEATYGTKNVVIECKSGCKLNYTEVIPELAIPRNTGQVVTQKMETDQDMSYVDATMEGTLTKSILDFLLELYTGTASTPFLNLNSCTRPGATLYRYTDIGTLETPTDDVYDVVVGALLTQLTLNFQQGSPITFSATFKGKSLTREVTNVTAGLLTLTSITDASHPNDEIAKYSDITLSLGGTAAITLFNGGTLTLTNELAGDDVLFQNSDTIINPYIVRAGGSLNATWMYDTDDDSYIYDNIQNTLQSDSITLLIGTTHQYVFATYGKIESYENPEVDRGKMMGSFTKKIMGDQSVVSPLTALTVTYLVIGA